MTLNMDVTIRLIDKLSTPARRAAEVLERIARSASRLNSGAAGNGLRGLSRALQGLDRAAPSASTVDRIERLGRAVVGLSKAGEAARGLSALSAAARGLSRSATSFERAANGAEKLARAFSSMPGSAGLGAVNAELREHLALQRQAATAARRATGLPQGRTFGHRGHVPVIGVLSPHVGIAGTSREVFDAGVSREHALTMLRLKGIAEKDRAALVAQAETLTKNDPSRTLGENLNLLNSILTGVGGEVAAAVKIAPSLANAATVLRYAGGKERTSEQVNETIYDLVRAGELQNLINKPEEMKDFISSVVAANLATGGHIDAKSWHSNLKYSRGANLGWNKDFTEHGFPFLMQELAGGNVGGPAGVALRAMFRAVPLATQKKENASLWRGIGMLDESKVDGKGRMQPGAIKDSKLATENPAEFVFEIIRKLKDAGITEKGDQQVFLNKVFGTATSSGAAMMLGFSEDRFRNFANSIDEVANSQAALKLINETSEQSVVKLQASFTDLTATVYSVLSPAFMKFADDLAGTSRVLNGKGSTSDALGAAGVGAIGTGGLIATAGVIASTVAGGAALAATLPAAAMAATAGILALGAKAGYDWLTKPADAPIAGKRAAGGPVRGGATYLVGEKGPELFTPGASGGITPNGGIGGYASLGDVGAGPRYIVAAIGTSTRLIVDAIKGEDWRGGGTGASFTRASYGGSGDAGGNAVSSPKGIASSVGRVGLWSGGNSPSKGLSGVKNLPIIKSAAERQLIAEGLSPEAAHFGAAALAGNAGQEGANPRAIHDKGTGLGIYGARDPGGRGRQRKSEMLAWLKANGYAWDSAEGQARYMAHEAMTNYPGTANALRHANAGNLDSVTAKVMSDFERPSRDPRVARLDNRLRFAREAARRAGNPHAGASSPSPAGQVPEALKQHEERRRQEKGQIEARNGAGAGHTYNVTVGGVHVQADKNHDPKQIAQAVHDKFNAAVASQLNDGFMSG